ncbi:MAG TPA: autotransporter domain-containing protein [Stellaceae bacterium]|jgi:outer membrane autotransporter protein|nr:autotransporter domain-containing protein [Stellaceae bacterium]
MKFTRFVLFYVAAAATGSTASFAQQSIVGAVPTPLSALGVTSGVSMTGQGGGGELDVGTVGGPAMNIFTNNSAGGNVTNPLLAAVTTDVASQSNIVFNSSSTVFGTIGTPTLFFLDLSGGKNGAAVNFDGDVNATITTVSGTGAINFNSGSTNTTATNFAGDGTISLAPNTTVIGALTTNTADTGTLMLGGGSVLTGAVGGATGLRAIDVVGGSNLAGVSAHISGAVDDYSFSLGTNTLTIGGALTIANQGPSGVIDTTLASATVFGNIRPVGTTLLGPTLTVNVSVPGTAFFPVGTQFNIVQTATGTPQSGTNGSVLLVVKDPTNPLFTFAPVPIAGTVNGLVAIVTTGIPLTAPLTPPPGVPLPPTAPLAAAAAAALLASNQTPDIVNVEAAVDSLSNPAAVVDALTQLAPSAPDVAAPLVTFQGTRQFQDLWLQRMDDVMCDEVDQRRRDDEPQTCRKNEPQSGWWAKAFGNFGEQDATGSFLGYKSRVVGTMIAYDAPLLGDEPPGVSTRGGIGIGYAHSAIDGKTLSASTDFNTYQATAYLTHERGPWFVQGDVSFGWNSYSGMRSILLPGISRVASASYDGQDYTAFASTGYHFFTQGFTLTPLASLQYTHVNLDGYTESGAGDIDLRVKSQSYDFVESGLGGKVARPFAYFGGTVVPETHFKWLHDLANPTITNTASFAAGSPTFSTPGFSTADDTFNIGGGITFLSCACTGANWSLEATYDYFWRSDNYSANQGMLKLSARF